MQSSRMRRRPPVESSTSAPLLSLRSCSTGEGGGGLEGKIGAARKRACEQLRVEAARRCKEAAWSQYWRRLYCPVLLAAAAAVELALVAALEEAM